MWPVYAKSPKGHISISLFYFIIVFALQLKSTNEHNEENQRHLRVPAYNPGSSAQMCNTHELTWSPSLSLDKRTNFKFFCTFSAMFCNTNASDSHKHLVLKQICIKKSYEEINHLISKMPRRLTRLCIWD